jgi:hypothetical protein
MSGVHPIFAKILADLGMPQDKPAAIIYEPHKRISCGCCSGNGTGAGMPGNDQCVCWMHQDTPRGRPVHVCAHHAGMQS